MANAALDAMLASKWAAERAGLEAREVSRASAALYSSGAAWSMATLAVRASLEAKADAWQAQLSVTLISQVRCRFCSRACLNVFLFVCTGIIFGAYRTSVNCRLFSFLLPDYM
jgi:hypothetical protein